MKRRCLLIIWLDGFRTDYLSKHTTPFIHDLSQDALIGEYEPSLGFTSIGASILTGISASKHGIWTEFCYDPEKSPFEWTGKASTINRFIDWITDHTSYLGRLARDAINLFIFKVSNHFSGRTYMPEWYRKLRV